MGTNVSKQITDQTQTILKNTLASTAIKINIVDLYW